MAGEALIVIDLQNDFCPGGALAVAGGDEIVPLVNELIARLRACRADAGLAPGRPFELRLEPSRQGALRDDRNALWRADAVAGPLHPGLAAARPSTRHSTWTKAELVIRKGFRPAIDSYSAFFENDHATPTGLAGYLRERGIGRLTLVGLATDFCVAYSALDAVGQGFDTTVRLDACRGIDLGGSHGDDAGQDEGRGVTLA